MGVINSKKCVKPSDVCNRLIVVDPSFIGWGGHYAQYDTFVSEGAAANSIDCLILANKLSNKKNNVIQAYSRDGWGKQKSKKLNSSVLFQFLVKWNVANRIFASFIKFLEKKHNTELASHPNTVTLKALRTLLRISGALTIEAATPIYYEHLESKFWLKRVGCTNRDVVFFHTVTNWNIVSVLKTALFLAKKKVSVKILFRYPSSFIDWNLGPLKKLLKVINEQKKLDISFFTDSQQLSIEYQTYFTSLIATAPIPVFNVNEPTLNANKDSIKCAILGNPREEKGITQTIEAINFVVKNYENIDFNVQANDPDLQSRIIVWNFLNKHKDSPRIKFFTEPLDSVEYARVLANSDIVLIPYSASSYRSRTSGVFAEAVANQKPVICTAGTWMEHEFKKYGCSGLVIDGSSAKEIINALIFIKENINFFKRKARIAAIKYRKINNSKNLINSLLSCGPSRNKRKKVVMLYPYENFHGLASGGKMLVDKAIRSFINNGFTVKFIMPEQYETKLKSDNKNSMLDIIYYPHTKNNVLNMRLINFIFTNIKNLWANSAASQLINCALGVKSTALYKLLLEEAVDAQLIFVNQLYQVAAVADFSKKYDIPLVAYSHDSLSAGNRFSLISILMRWFEYNMIEKCDRLLSISPEEVMHFRSISSNDVVHTPPIVNVARDVIKNHTDYVANLINFEGGCRYFLFVGSKHRPNYIAQDRLKSLAKKWASTHPTWRIIVVGDCGSPIKSTSNIVYTGKVPYAVLDELYLRCDLVLSPLPKSTGVSIKIIEAMQHKKVIIGSREAFRGLNVQSYHECIIENNIDNFEIHISKVLNNRPMYKLISDKAYICGQAYSQDYIFKSVSDMLVIE